MQQLGARHIAGELRDIIGGRLHNQFFRAADLHHQSFVHNRDAVGEFNRLVEVMRDEHNGAAFQQRLQAQEFVLQFFADERVQRRERFVEKPHFRVDTQRPCQTDALLLAAGQLAGIITFAPGQAHHFDDFARFALARVAVDALHFQRERDVVDDGAVRQQREVLKHHAHLVAANVNHLFRRRLQQVRAVEQHFTVSRLNQARQTPHQSRLAGAAQTHHHQNLAFKNIEGGVAHRGNVVVRLQRRIVRRAAVRVEELARLFAVQFPDVAALNFGGRGHGARVSFGAAIVCDSAGGVTASNCAAVCSSTSHTDSA